MSVDALLNMSEGDGDRDESQDRRNELMDKEDQVVRMLSLHTQASHATLRPTPLDTSHIQSRAHPLRLGQTTRKRARPDAEEEDDDGDQYQGMTPSTWKRWKESEGVNGSGYCYAYDTNGESKSIETWSKDWLRR
jgi:hypothetical protein